MQHLVKLKHLCQFFCHRLLFNVAHWQQHKYWLRQQYSEGIIQHLG